MEPQFARLTRVRDMEVPVYRFFLAL